jgi:hypothetical protein
MAPTAAGQVPPENGRAVRIIPPYAGADLV